MKKFTEEYLKTFERDEDGFLICPTGDYTSIKNFDDRCRFGESCSFGDSCSFGVWCSFGAWCSFSKCCSFGKCCSFDNICSFGRWCNFGNSCKFGDDCSFGTWCEFGEGCSFGACCSFENGHKAKDGYPLILLGGFGSVNRTTYAFNTEDGIIIRCGCFCGTLDKFREKVKEKHKDTQLGKEYLMIADLIAMKWGGSRV